ncbi:hypothetical protein CkaCkLH20_10568 [Colletotrichum karsti]|uniref:Hypersensitive response-inducing protein n=1 Tax=Colletotrichum karsti TaxID=1095194 RepID=A0A9P6LG88_9PEZI|nr:uncharacterized protein CkaCkLH20_10568 [Colletotrichum karsti]KAF9871936.1 hypothetical protein CkaCkLH20_10568 [Colletotrichum karsti]
MKFISVLLTLGGIASAAAEPTKYQLVNFYAGSGPKSSFTTYSFDIGFIADDGTVTKPARCSHLSSSNWHDGYIVSTPPTPCTVDDAYYGFLFRRVQTPEPGYLLNLTDADGGVGSTFYPQSLVYRVQNNANPNDPDPFPNYALSDPEAREVERD